MKEEKIKIGGKTYDIVIVESDEEKEKGLQDLESIPENEGLLFVIDEDDKDEDGLIWFTMEDTKIPLDIIFLDDDYEVISIAKGEPLSETPIYGKGDYVLEISADSGVKIGDELEYIDNDKMLLLGSNGEIQLKLEGGERIMSIKNTKTLIKFAKRANASKLDKDYKAVGTRVFKFLDIQDNNEPEYVDVKD